MKLPLVAISALVAAFSGSANAENVVYLNPVGCLPVKIPAASDAALGAPLSRASEYQGVIQSISGNEITVASAPKWAAGRWVYAQNAQPKTYYMRIDSGAKEGLVATITASSDSSFTVKLPEGETLADVSSNASPLAPAVAGDSISIVPFWTPATLIKGVATGTQILRYPTSKAGINLIASTVYTYSGVNWMQGTTVVNDVPFGATEGFVVRNNATKTAQNILISGSVPLAAHRSILQTRAAKTSQDQRFFYNSPIPETLANAFPTAVLSVGDRLIAYNNLQVGKNKAPSAVLVWNGTAWKQGTSTVTNTFKLQPGASYIFRKNQNPTASTAVVWSDLQSYLK